jgi:decaprenylphospho-beta-D-erythro-pentofuranosid-2-ulose 2-reductase
MKAAILGATKGIGRSMARQMAERGDSLVLLGRDPDQLERSAADLRIRSEAGGRFGTAHCDLADPDSFDPALEAADQFLEGMDCVIVTAGVFAVGDQLDEDVELVRQLTTLNYAHTVVFCELARKRLLPRRGTLVVFSSVAGDRGRKPVAVYGSAKAGLSTYLEALDHKYRGAGLTTICVKPGFVKTSMTQGLKPPPFAGTPEGVARDVLKAMGRRRPLVYTPAAWRLVMLVIRWLPRAVMRRINF